VGNEAQLTNPDPVTAVLCFLCSKGGAWNDYNRNITLARKCLKKMAEMGFKVCILSKDVSKDPELAPFVKSGHLIIHKFGAS